MRTSTRLTLLALSAGALLAPACGGDKKSDPDSRVSDTNMTPDTPGTPDAVVQNRSATLAVTELKLTDPTFTNYGGASISLAFNDLTKGGGTMTFGTGAVGGCTVIEYDGGATPTRFPNPAVDEGPVTIDGGGLKEPGPYHCAFANGSYSCVGETGAGKAGKYSVTDGGIAGQQISIDMTPGKSFAATDVGKYVVLTGFADAGLNKAYPIVGVLNGVITIAAGPGSVTIKQDEPFTGVGYTLLQGVGPVPGGAATVNFIDLDKVATPLSVTIALAANAEYPAGYTKSLIPIGQNMKLSGPGGSGMGACPDCTTPDKFPFTLAADQTITFSCDEMLGDGTGNCGDNAGAVNGTVLTGTTTDGPITGAAAALPYVMPPPVTKWASFTCTFPFQPAGMGKIKATIPHDALAAILATNPTRIETRFFRFSFDQFQDSTSMNTINAVVGHGFVGHSTKP